MKKNKRIRGKKDRKEEEDEKEGEGRRKKRKKRRKETVRKTMDFRAETCLFISDQLAMYYGVHTD